MRTVSSLAALQRDAMRTGATLADKGAVFNAGGARIAPKPAATKPAPVVVPEPPEQPKEQAVTLRMVAAMLKAQSEALNKAHKEEMDRLRSDLLAAIAKQPEPAKPKAPTEVRFKIERDADGNMKEIVLKR